MGSEQSFDEIMSMMNNARNDWERKMTEHDATEQRIPLFAVIDMRDGYAWVKDAKGDPLRTLAQAREYADSRNVHLKPEYQTYEVFRLTAPVDTEDDL